MSSLEILYKTVQQAGLALKSTADQPTRQAIDNELSSLERQWLDIDARLRATVRTATSTVQLWDDVESSMETVLERLKETRVSLTKPLPAGYDDLEKELRHCQVCSLVLLFKNLFEK